MQNDIFKPIVYPELMWIDFSNDGTKSWSSWNSDLSRAEWNSEPQLWVIMKCQLQIISKSRLQII